MRGCPPFLCSSALSPICRCSYIGRLQNGEVQTERGSAAVQKYGGMKYRDAVIQRWGEGRSPSSHLFFPSSLLIFLMLTGYSSLLYGLFRELLQVFRGLLKVFKLFSKNF